MAVLGEIVLMLSFLFSVANTDVSEPIFRAKGTTIEMGYCFGVDYIAVFRSAPGGDQLLGNSSEDAATTSLPNDLQGRVTITNHQQLLGLQISQLRQSDSGVYRRECWQNKELINRHEHQLSVCDKEVDSMEIALLEDGGAELLCNNTSIGLKGSTIRWYHDVPPLYKATLFLDSNVSLVPLTKELQGIVEVQRGGAELRVPQSVLQKTHKFNCLVIHGQNCLSFQNIYLPDSEDHKTIIASEGERVVMVCPAAHKSIVQRWDTPLSKINSTTMAFMASDENVKAYPMYLQSNGLSGNYSLVISAVSDKYSGDYSCFAPSLVVEYSLIVCPKMTSKKKSFSLGEDVVLDCDIAQDESQNVLWFRPGAHGEDSLILDSRNDNISIPKDLKGRVHLADEGFSLHLSSVTGDNVGEYWCVILTSLQYDQEYGDDNPENDNEYSEDYIYDSESSQWSGVEQCISKQVTYLTLADTHRRETAPSNTAICVVVAVVVLVAFGLAVGIAMVVMKKRRKSRHNKEENGINPMSDSVL